MAHVVKSMISSPIDARIRQEITDCIKKVITIFSTNYVKYYGLFLVKKALDDAARQPPPDFHLMQRPARLQPFKEGYVIKEAGYFTRTLEKRYFRVRPDYKIDYFVTEEEAKKEGGKKKGTISLCGYHLNPDANQGTIQRLFKLAERFGIDTSSLPKPKEYPKNTMEIYHDRRSKYYIQVEDDDEFKSWLDQIGSCIRNARGFVNQDPVHMKAYEKAIYHTRRSLGRWSWWGGNGTEEQVLSDLIADELDWDIMGRVYAKLIGPWPIRYAARNQVLKVIDKLVIAAVTPAWKAMSSTVEALRPKIEPTIQEKVGPIGELQLSLLTKIKESCIGIINPAMEKHVVPHISKIITIIQLPVGEGYNKSYDLFKNEALERNFEPKEDPEENKKHFHHLDHFPYTHKMWENLQGLEELYEPLWALNLIFPDISPRSLIWHGQDEMRKMMDSAIYTFEQKLIEAQEKKEFANVNLAVENIRQNVLEEYKHDGDLARVIYFRHILKTIIMPVLLKVVEPLVAELLKPIEAMVPEPMAVFFDIHDMFNQVVNGVVDGVIGNALK